MASTGPNMAWCGLHMSSTGLNYGASIDEPMFVVYPRKQPMLKRSILTSTLVVFALLATPTLAHTAVRIDPSFGSNGIVEGRFGAHYQETSFITVTSQPNGAVLAARRNGSESQAWLRRYNPDGTLDTSFAPERVTDEVEGVEEDGKVLKGIGRSLVRLNPDGTPDPTFGVRPYGTGKVSEEVGFTIEDIEPMPSGKILVGGSIIVVIPETRESPGETRIEQLAVARFDHEGRLDAGFGSAGIVKLNTDFGLAGKRLRGLAPRPAEGVAVIILDSLPSQYGEAVSHSSSAIVGLRSNGRLDPSYGSAGVVRLDDAVETFHALPDGELFVAGDRWGPELIPHAAHESDVVLSRYTANGQPDPNFGDGDGSTIVDFGGIALTRSALWGSDGSVLLGGSTTQVNTSNCRLFYRFCRETPFIIRFTPNGSLDTGFGIGGSLRLDALSAPYAPLEGGTGVLALGARPGGEVVAAGGSGIAAFIAALSPSGALDPSFGSGGVITETEPSASRSAGHAAVVDSRGRILVAGGTNADMVGGAPEGAVFRYLPNGSLDRSFGGGSGYARIPGGGSGIAVLGDGSSFVLSDRFLPVVTGITAGGEIDTSFGEEGTVQLPATVDILRNGKRYGLYVDPSSIAVLPGGGLLVSGTAHKGESRVVVFRLRPNGNLDPSFGRQGIAVLGFGQSHHCSASQMVVQHDGRIVLAGYVNGPINEVRSEALALMRLRPDGARDQSFGNKGLAVTRIGHRSFASALAIQRNGQVVVAGRARVRSGVRELLLRYGPDGRLDRRFAQNGISSIFAPLRPGGFSSPPRQILLLRHRILVLRDHPHRALVAYSNDGRHHRSFIVARGTEPDHHGIRAPFGAIQDSRIILGWETFAIYNSFKLQRLHIH